MEIKMKGCGDAPSEDVYWMRHALRLAEKSLHLSQPNPRVGCVIRRDGRTLAEGHTQQAGGRHAEAQALFLAQEAGQDVRGATVYVSLEPCSHTGRTGPCVDALIAAGVARVVCATFDPNPAVAGQGVARLEQAGIAVEVGLLAQEARQLNIGFFSRMLRQRPWLRLKVASSLDAYTALPDGTSQWITAAEARQDGQRWRGRADVVCTGIGTILVDDPLLNVRTDPAAVRQPHLVILDTHLRLPLSARCLAPSLLAERQVWVVHSPLADADRRQALAAAGVRTIAVPEQAGRVDVVQAMQAVQAQLPANEWHLEAGATLNGSFLAAGLVDELLWYQAPKLLGQGRPVAEMAAASAMEAAWQFEHIAREQLGPDVRLRLLAQAAVDFWRGA